MRPLLLTLAFLALPALLDPAPAWAGKRRSAHAAKRARERAAPVAAPAPAPAPVVAPRPAPAPVVARAQATDDEKPAPPRKKAAFED